MLSKIKALLKVIKESSGIYWAEERSNGWYLSVPTAEAPELQAEMLIMAKEAGIEVGSVNELTNILTSDEVGFSLKTATQGERFDIYFRRPFSN